MPSRPTLSEAQTSALIHCDKHGEGDATFVCKHIVASLDDGIARGFLWGLDDEGGYQAICIECNEMPFADWQARSAESCTMICYSCFMQAAQLNGISQSEIAAVRQ